MNRHIKENAINPLCERCKLESTKHNVILQDFRNLPEWMRFANSDAYWLCESCVQTQKGFRQARVLKVSGFVPVSIVHEDEDPY